MVFTKAESWLIAKKYIKIENRSLSCQCWSLHGLQTWLFICDRFKLVANFGCNRFRIMPEIVSEVAVLLDWNLMQKPSSYTGHRFRSTGHDCHRIGNCLCLCLPVQPTEAVTERGPKSSVVDFAVKLLIVLQCLLVQPSRVIARRPAGART